MCNSSRAPLELTGKALKNSFSGQPPTAYIYAQIFIFEMKALERNRKWTGASVLPYHFSLLAERQAEDETSTDRQARSAQGQEGFC